MKLKSLKGKLVCGLALTAVTTGLSVATTTGPAAATQVGDTKIVRLDNRVFGDAVQAYNGMYYHEGVWYPGAISAETWTNASSQKWAMNVEWMAPDGSYWIVTFRSLYGYSTPHCLDHYASEGTSHPRVWVYPCRSGDNQKWRIWKVADGAEADAFEIQNKWNGRWLRADWDGIRLRVDSAGSQEEAHWWWIHVLS